MLPRSCGQYPHPAFGCYNANRMKWYWLWIIIGLLAPWIIMGRAIRMGFEERGLQTGLGVWFGAALLTVPLMLAIGWLVQVALG